MEEIKALLEGILTEIKAGNDILAELTTKIDTLTENEQLHYEEVCEHIANLSPADYISAY